MTPLALRTIGTKDYAVIDDGHPVGRIGVSSEVKASIDGRRYDSTTGLISIIGIGGRWPDTRATHERLIAGRANHGDEGTATLDAARRSTPPRNHNATANRRGNPWRFLPYTLLKINRLLDPTI